MLNSLSQQIVSIIPVHLDFAVRLLSFRFRYSDMLDARMQAQIGVLMRLSIEAIDGIRQEFMQAPGHALDVMGFVDTVGRCAKHFS
jgi:hypothetical protein